VGRTINKIGNVQKHTANDEQTEHVMFVITTDGMENASREFSCEKVRQMIERQKSKYGWEFIFLGANIDAISTAERFGISKDRATNYNADSEGTLLNYEVISETVSCMRASRPITEDWKERIEDDFKKRGGRR
jgi:hypothetical protein